MSLPSLSSNDLHRRSVNLHITEPNHQQRQVTHLAVLTPLLHRTVHLHPPRLLQRPSNRGPRHPAHPGGHRARRRKAALDDGGGRRSRAQEPCRQGERAQQGGHFCKDRRACAAEFVYLFGVLLGEAGRTTSAVFFSVEVQVRYLPFKVTWAAVGCRC